MYSKMYPILVIFRNSTLMVFPRDTPRFECFFSIVFSWKKKKSMIGKIDILLSSCQLLFTSQIVDNLSTFFVKARTFFVFDYRRSFFFVNLNLPIFEWKGQTHILAYRNWMKNELNRNEQPYHRNTKAL